MTPRSHELLATDLLVALHLVDDELAQNAINTRTLRHLTAAVRALRPLVREAARRLAALE